MKYYTKELSAELWSDFTDYFEYTGSCSGCWCMNHRLPMGLDFEGEAAKLAMKQLVETNRVYGVLAYEQGDSTPVGWASLDRRKTLPGHDCIAEDIDCEESSWSIHCISSRSDKRGLGIEKILAEEAIQLAKKMKATEVEAYPEPNSEEGKSYKTWNTFNGHESTFKAMGFESIDKNFGECGEFYRPLKLVIEKRPQDA